MGLTFLKMHRQSTNDYIIIENCNIFWKTKAVLRSDDSSVPTWMKGTNLERKINEMHKIVHFEIWKQVSIYFNAVTLALFKLMKGVIIVLKFKEYLMLQGAQVHWKGRKCFSREPWVKCL